MLVMGSSGQLDPLFTSWDEGDFGGHLSKAQEGSFLMTPNSGSTSGHNRARCGHCIHSARPAWEAQQMQQALLLSVHKGLIFGMHRFLLDAHVRLLPRSPCPSSMNLP